MSPAMSIVLARFARVPGSKFQVPSFKVQGFGFWVLDFEFVSDFGF